MGATPTPKILSGEFQGYDLSISRVEIQALFTRFFLEL